MAEIPHLTVEQLAQISRSTIEHYNNKAHEFRRATWQHDVSQNIQSLLKHAGPHHPLSILDLGCGPGRDLVQFSRLGHKAIGLDGAEMFCQMARQASGCDVWHQDLLDLDLPALYFDAIFANAVLFQIPQQCLHNAMVRMYDSLKPGGVLLSSNPRGRNEEGWQHDRYGVYYDIERWTEYLQAAGFTPLEHYYRPPGLPRPQQPWLVTVWRKI